MVLSIAMRTLAVAAAVAAAALSSSPAVAERAASQAACTAPAKTLTFQCGTTCGANIPCLANTTTVDGAEVCSIKCQKAVYATEDSFQLFVRFGAWKSAQELAEPPSSPSKPPAETDSYLTLSNDILDTLEPPQLTNKVTAVAINGGIYYAPLIRGHVANVKFPPAFLSNASSVTTVRLRNLNLQPQADAIAGLLPAQLKRLSLDNGLFTDMPKGLDAFQNLTTLSFNRNYLTTVNSTFSMDGLMELNMTQNDIKTFTALFPKLRTLELSSNQLQEVPAVLSTYTALRDLSLESNNLTAFPSTVPLPSTLTSLRLYGAGLKTYEAVAPGLWTLNLTNNNLTTIPFAVYNHTKLAELFLSGNPIQNATLTPAQFSFLASLSSFTIDTGSLVLNCDPSQQKTIRKNTYCVIGDDATTLSDKKESSSSSLGLILGIVGGVVVVAVIATIVYTRRNNKRAQEMTISTMNITNGTGGTKSLWTDPDLIAVKVNAADIEDVKAIGKGAFGDVWLVKYRKTQLLASKRLRKSGVTAAQTQNFIDEIKLVAKLEHPHIVAFIGAAWTIQSDLQALFEYMDGGDLRDYLKSAQTPKQWTPEKLQIAIDVAEALVYVHSFAPPLVHRDLKSRNVLLSSELRAKLTDFGVSRFRSEDNTMTSGVGTGKWLAPEVISGSTDYGAPADIFSFGAVLTELDSHELPYDGVRGPNGAPLADVALLQLIASGDVRPHFGQACPPKLAEIGDRCLALNPSERPAAAEIAYALRQLKKSMYAVM